MSNRAIRRQQAAGSKKSASGSSQRAIPRTGPAPSAPAGKRKGVQRFLPRFAVEIFSELRKVIWPTRRDVTYLTFVVILVAIIMGALLGAIDFAFGWLIDQTLLE